MGTTLFPISSANPSASLSEVSPEDSLGACHRTRLGKRKSSLGIKVSPPSFSAYLIVTIHMTHNFRSCGYGLKENPPWEEIRNQLLLANQSETRNSTLLTHTTKERATGITQGKEKTSSFRYQTLMHTYCVPTFC